MPSPYQIDRLDTAVEHVLATVQGDIVLGIPLGIGKPNPFVNALYRRIKADGQRRLRIITALSLERPVGKSDIERHFLAPIAERVFADYPDLDYVKDLRGEGLPPNIEVMEFFLKTGDYLGNEEAQRAYISTNYTFAARDMAGQGINLVAQAVACRQDGDAGESASLSLSLSCNPDLTVEVVEALRRAGQPVMTVAMINERLPFMPNGACVPTGFFDLIIRDPVGTHTLFAPPNNKVGVADYAIGLHAASLVVDGGTLQIGIGSLGDAIAQALIVRNGADGQFEQILQSLVPAAARADTRLTRRETGPFKHGLYGCSEMFVNGFMRLIDAGIVCRQVWPDASIQSLVNDGRIPAGEVTRATLMELVHAGRVGPVLSTEDIRWLRRMGILNANVQREGDQLRIGGLGLPNDLLDDRVFDTVVRHGLGTQLQGGIFMTGGFFLGPGDFYERLRRLPHDTLAKIDMTRIDFINQLYGADAHEVELKRLQRKQARFMNTTMMVTLLGAAVSDSLENGQVVSGVGGQYNFVAMAHALHDARSVLMLRATHENKHGLKSSIVWNYGHVTIPRHLRDIVITEYGVAELRGQSDGEVVKRLICIADSRFQNELMHSAKANGKLEAHWEVPEDCRHNTPQALYEKLHPWMARGVLPDFPFGTDLTDEELEIVRALKRMKHASEHPLELVQSLLRSFLADREPPQTWLERLGLDEAKGLKDVLARRLFAGNL